MSKDELLKVWIAELYASRDRVRDYHPLFELWVGANDCLLAIDALSQIGDYEAIIHLSRLIEWLEAGPRQAPMRTTNAEVIIAAYLAIEKIENDSINADR